LPNTRRAQARTVKLRNLTAPRRHDALDISRRACAKLFGKIMLALQLGNKLRRSLAGRLVTVSALIAAKDVFEKRPK
jgi:hypothetical protein